MIEKIRVSLWDIFTFFLTGLILVVWSIVYLYLIHKTNEEELLKLVTELPASFTLFLAPLSLTALGMLYEPIANYFDKFLNKFWFKVFPKKDKHVQEEEQLREIIRTKYLGPLCNEIEEPYHLCKEYVSTKELSTTFMVFLSRYGFYRNIAFLSFLSAIVVFGHLGFSLKSFAIATALLVLAGILKKRAEDFYSYLAPCVFRCYLIEKGLSVE